MLSLMVRFLGLFYVAPWLGALPLELLSSCPFGPKTLLAFTIFTRSALWAALSPSGPLASQVLLTGASRAA